MRDTPESDAIPVLISRLTPGGNAFPAQQWGVGAVFDYAVCQDCVRETNRVQIELETRERTEAGSKYPLRDDRKKTVFLQSTKWDK
jgi:hypothetical protein